MLTGIHFLLSYSCTYECDHCFLYCSPSSEGTFTLEQIRTVFGEIEKIGTIEWVYFEGGEPFLYYPLMVEGVRMTKAMGLKAGTVSNAYWATTEEDAGLWLKALKDLRIDDLSLSEDAFHGSDEDNASQRAFAAARKLKIPVETICIEEPTVRKQSEGDLAKGEPVIGGGVLLKGRAVEKLAEGLPRRPVGEFITCPHEELEKPSRVHIDSFGHAHICQGISLGNMWEQPLCDLVTNYQPQFHAIAGPLIQGGPWRLAEAYSIKLEQESYVDECHYCFEVRKALIDKFPEYLAPRQVYGLES
jgi:hypothetical protein